MEAITIVETYHPGDTFYACPLNNEYLKAKQQAGRDVDYAGSTSDGIQESYAGFWVMR